MAEPPEDRFGTGTIPVGEGRAPKMPKVAKVKIKHPQAFKLLPNNSFEKLKKGSLKLFQRLQNRKFRMPPSWPNISYVKGKSLKTTLEKIGWL